MRYPGWRVRDQLASQFRFNLLSRLGHVPFFHQAQIYAYLDRKDLAVLPTCDADDIPQGGSPALRAWIEGVEHWLIAVPRFEDIEVLKYGKKVVEPVPLYKEGGYPEIAYRYFEVAPSDRPRPRVLALSAAFKGGKSEPGGIIPASFAICPGLRWDIYGYEYDICEPEFEYLSDLLLSEDGMNLPVDRKGSGQHPLTCTKYQCEPSMGRMTLRLSNDARFTCRSMRISMEDSKSDPLKGKQRDGFTVAEVYQFPSIQALLGYRQNLAARNGYYTMFSTPDRPIMDEINERADPENSEFPTWLGVAEVHRRENPYAFVLEDWLEDMRTFSEEEFTVYWEGKSGRWIGAVYPPPQFFDVETHPWLWKDGDDAIRGEGGEVLPIIENFAPPVWMSRMGGSDTGTLYAVVSALSDDVGNVFLLHDTGNYRYVAGQVEQIKERTIESVCSEARGFRGIIGGKWPSSYVDPNCQFRDEFKNAGVPLRKGVLEPEHRTEVTRGMAQNGFVWFAPWLRGSELVMEWQAAKFPPQETSTGKRRRVKKDDHRLDCVEHLCAKHPKARRPDPLPMQNPIQAMLSARRRRPNRASGDPQIGGV